MAVVTRDLGKTCNTFQVRMNKNTLFRESNGLPLEVTWPKPHVDTDRRANGADDGLRTRDLQLGKLALYQLSYVRVDGYFNTPGVSPFPS